MSDNPASLLNRVPTTVKVIQVIEIVIIGNPNDDAGTWDECRRYYGLDGKLLAEFLQECSNSIYISE